MGTNYYWKTDDGEKCECCGRFDRGEKIHIGKSSCGWTFSFHGTDEIRSYKDWLERLESGGVIFDEYGREVSVAKFRDLVESKKGAEAGHTTYCRRYHPPATGHWLDEEGHSFSAGEFS